MAEGARRGGALTLSGASLKAAVYAAESPMLSELLRARFFAQLGLERVMAEDLRGVEGAERPALLPVLRPDLGRRGQGS